MDSHVKQLIKQGDELFNKRGSLLSLWQEQAEHFYPERAEFTASRNVGRDFASNLTTSYPLIARRELGNTFSAMLRPNDREWFHIRCKREEQEDNDAKVWLQRATSTMRRAMYDRVSQFVRASKEGDHDFATFGQCGLTTELGRNRDSLLYRCWHLRDLAWCEGHDGQICEIHRKWKPDVRTVKAIWRDKVDPKVNDALAKDPYTQIEVRHIVMRSEDYAGEKKFRQPWVSIFIDVDNGFVMEETGVWSKIYTIPRWQTVSGSQYAYSPATVAALPDARLIQAMSLVLLEAGEKAVNPPMIATEEMIRSDIQVYAGGITWVDADYDEKLGEVLRPITQDKSGLSFGMELRDDVRNMIAQAFFLNKISLPPAASAGDMTATEISQRVQEYVRNALPLFEPMELDYNGSICEDTFDLLMRGGAFGSIDMMPQSLRGKEIEFRFESPLHAAIEQKNGQIFMEAKQMLAQAVELDPGVARMIDVRTAMRDALNGIQVPAKWLRSEEQMKAIDQADQQQQQARQLLETMGQGATVAKTIGEAGQSFQSMQGG